MGKTTKYHPVSLHVIRGAAEYCGWKFSEIRQRSSYPDLGKARYVAVIEAMPKRVWGTPTTNMQEDLQGCFLDDIRVHWLHQVKSGKWWVDIQVNLPASETPPEATETTGGGGGGGGPDDDWDGLHVCSICGDRYTTGDICHVCAAQVQIDKDPRPETYWCHQCGQYQARWEGALCLSCWLESRKPAGNGDGGGGGGGDYIRLDGGPDEDADDTNCHNEDCYYCSQAILDEDEIRQDSDGHCWHDRCFMDARDEAENRDRSDPSLMDWS